MLDSSTTVSNTDFEKMLNMTKVFVNGTNIGDGKVQIGVVVYSTGVNKPFYLNSYHRKQEIMERISNIKRMFGEANLADAIQETRVSMFNTRNGDRPDIPNVAMIITASESNNKETRVNIEAEKAKNDDIRIFIIGVGLDDAAELNNIASTPLEDNAISIKDFDELQWRMDVMYLSLCPGKILCCVFVFSHTSRLITNILIFYCI